MTGNVIINEEVSVSIRKNSRFLFSILVEAFDIWNKAKSIDKNL